MRILATAAILVASFATAHADSYTAVSNTAMSITGDIEFDDSGITFANGETLAFSDLVADRFRVDGRNVNASVYSIEEPADPELENGNLLCGSGDVTYLASWAAGDGMTAIAVFTSDTAPRNSNSMCGMYLYEDQ